jgi:hypothetical protein
MKVACANPNCPNGASRPAFHFGRRTGGLERDGRWFCSAGCLASWLADSAIEARRHGLRRVERRIKLGLLLLKNNLIERDKLIVALEQKGHSLKKLGEILVESGYLTEKELSATLAIQAGVAPVNLDPGQAVRLKELVPLRLFADFGFVVFNHDDIGRDLSVAVHDADHIPVLEIFFAGLLPDHRVRFYFEEKRKLQAILLANFPGMTFGSEPGGATEGNGESRVETVILRFIEFLNVLPATDIKVDNRDRAICVTARHNGINVDACFSRVENGDGPVPRS